MNKGKNTLRFFLGTLLKIIGVCGIAFFVMVIFTAISDSDEEVIIRIMAVFLILLIEGVFVGLYFLGRKLQLDVFREKMSAEETVVSQMISVRCDGCGASVPVKQGKTVKCAHCGGKIRG